MTKEDRVAEAKESTSDLVTETDKKVEELIISTLRQQFPKHQYVISDKLFMITCSRKKAYYEI